MGRVPEPELDAGGYLVEVLFQVGPSHGEAPLSEADLEPWERRRGIELQPWEAEAVVSMSQAYLGESYNARKQSALPPWPGARNMWKYVCDKIHVPAIDENLATPINDKAAHGNRKRHRNPAPG